jgi:hypothetical protein
MLTAIIGNMGAGKTATLAYLAKHFYNQHENIFCNFVISDIKHKYVLSVNDIDNVKFGKAFYDEFWLWLDSRCSTYDEYNKKISDILLKSRKRGYDIYYTLQGFYQIDKRVRNVTDYILLPESYLFKDGELNKVDQDFLYPIDMKPYVDQIVIYVDVCRPCGEYELEKVDSFSFWLKDVASSYDTSEEIQDIKNPLQKGIFIEGVFMKVLKENIEGCIITQSPNSGHYMNALDIEIQSKNNLYLIDVCSIQNRKINGYEYEYIDMRKKDIKKISKISSSRNGISYFAYELNRVWYMVQINENLVSMFEGKVNVNVRDLKKYQMTIDQFKETII